MADGPRCQRRKQANPRRSNVRTFSNVSEAASDSDDEDKLHIVEEDSISDAPEEKPTVFQLNAAKQTHNGHKLNDGNLGPDALIQEIRVKEECVTDEEDGDGQANATPWQGNKGATYPEVPEKEQGTPERGVHDENGTPDEFSQLHTCPYCSRGYKRHTSLKEHVKLRHEKSEDDFSCSLCSYTFTYRTQLDRHMTTHKNGRDQRTVTHTGGNRKFKCTECSKAFKYKHHLKEHLRIHSGEKPYECSNCKKRFSHSGSYSSHISSKKCVAAPPAVNGLSHTPGVKAALTLSRPTRILLREKSDTSNKPLQEQLPPKQIKEEPVDHELKPVTSTAVVTTTTITTATAATTTTTSSAGGMTVQPAASQGVVQTLVLPTVGLVQPISINLSDLQNVLKAAMEGNVIQQVVATTNANGGSTKVVGQVQPQAPTVVVQAPQPQAQVISAISLPVLDQDGNAKIIINYSVDPQISMSKINTAQAGKTQPTVAQTKTLQPNVTPQKVVQVNSTQAPKVIQVNSTQPAPALVQVNSTQAPKVVQVNSAQPPKVVQVNTTQPITLSQIPSTPKGVPAQLSILKPTQTTNSNKSAPIIKVTKLVPAHPAQTKLTQPTLLLLRRTDGTQGLVVRQLATVNPNIQVTSTTDSQTLNLKSAPEKVTAAAADELNQTTEDTTTNSVSDDGRPRNLSSSLLQGNQIKSEPKSPAEIESEMQTDPSPLDEEEEDSEERTTKVAGSDSTTVHSSVVCGDGFHNYATCLFCDNPSSTDILSCLNSDEQGTVRSLSSVLEDENSGSLARPPLESLLPLLKAYSKDPNPSKEQLSRVAESVSLPLDAVSRWFERMRSKKISLRLPGHPKTTQQATENTSPKPCINTQTTLNTPTEPSDDSAGLKNISPSSPLNLSTNDLVIVKTEDTEEDVQAEPLDLSLPKSSCNDAGASVAMAMSTTKPSLPVQEEPLNLTCLKKDMLPGNTIYVTQSAAGPINIVATPLPTLLAIAEPVGVPCLQAANSTTKRTILIPQLSYTYATPSTNTKANATTSQKANTTTTSETQGTVILNECQKEKTEAGVESGWEGLEDSDMSPNRKRRKIQAGQYACDLCDKIFQKSSSLLRHKYEHTGRRPHECGICKKAFKHKHHLIEHTRLHSGEKPYQCDKCGKRFSHSGSYSQHMNHRYSYCKKEPHNPLEPANASSTPPSQLDSDERESEAEEEDEEDEEREGEGEGEEDISFAGFDMSDIRVVRVGEEYEEEEEEEEGGEQVEHEGETAEAMELQIKDIRSLGEEGKESIDTGDMDKRNTEKRGEQVTVESSGVMEEEEKND